MRNPDDIVWNPVSGAYVLPAPVTEDDYEAVAPCLNRPGQRDGCG